jgi:CRP/FNR family transcriptional regulator, cyclic AMP receptor protein
MEDAVSHEKLLGKYIKEDKKELAVKLLFDSIANQAQANHFSTADALREKLFEVDSLAVAEIVKSAEIIEAAKIAAIDQVHRRAWSPLYDQLTKEETVALYFGMQTASYETGQVIFRQGEINSNLYFINSGQMKIFYHKDKHGILLKTLGPGDLAGEDSFFTHSTCTTSMMAHSPVELNFLQKKVLQKWRNDVPNLANKLQDYCSRLEPVKELLQKKEIERRSHRRYVLSGTAIIRIVDRPAMKIFKGDLCDISTSGISIIMNTSAKSAESLLGCRLNLKFTLSGTFPEIRIDQNGRILGVHDQIFNEYLINVKWDIPLEDGIFDRIKLTG